MRFDFGANQPTTSAVCVECCAEFSLLISGDTANNAANL
jgi:hypothetical protein